VLLDIHSGIAFAVLISIISSEVVEVHQATEHGAQQVAHADAPFSLQLGEGRPAPPSSQNPKRGPSTKVSRLPEPQ
jgi:hypothetical protein